MKSAERMFLAVEIAYCGEGQTDAALARRLIIFCGGVPGANYILGRGPHGKEQLDKRLRGLAIGAEYGTPTLVLRDLDQDAVCAGVLRGRLLPAIPRLLCLRIAVRSAEAWLMADREGFARAARIPAGRVSLVPEALENPKTTMVELLAASRAQEVRALGWQRGRPQPQLLGAWTSMFIAEAWNIERAANASPSLAKALLRVRALCAGRSTITSAPG